MSVFDVVRLNTFVPQDPTATEATATPVVPAMKAQVEAETAPKEWSAAPIAGPARPPVVATSAPPNKLTAPTVSILPIERTRNRICLLSSIHLDMN